MSKGFHEEIGNRIIEEDSKLRETLNNISPGLSKDIKTVKERNFLGLNYLFEGQFDVDRSDDKHPNRKVPLMTFENAIIIIEKPQLMEKVKDKEKLQEVLLLTQKQKSK